MADPYFADPVLAGLYDQFNVLNARRDFEFYVPLVFEAQSVLDIGCGTGALLAEARRLGHAGRLCGLDPAPGMIACARKHPDVEWHCGELADFAARDTFDLVLMTGHAFQVFITDEDIRAVLGGIHALLRSGALLAFETRNPQARAWESWTGPRLGLARDADGHQVAMSTRVDRVCGDRVTFTHRFTSIGWPHDRLSQSTLRFLNTGALRALLEEAGFSLESLYGDWDRSPATESSPELIVLARKR